MMPAFAFADETKDAVDDSTAGTQTQEQTQVQTQEQALAQEQEQTQVQTQAQEHGDTSEADIPDEEVDVDADTDEISGMELVETEDVLPDPDELLQKYLDTKIDAETGTTLKDHSGSGSGVSPKVKLRAKRNTRYDSLSNDERAAYDMIRPFIEKIASGKADTAEFSVDHLEGVSYSRVIRSMVIDMPYEFYWYDKVEGCLHGISTKDRNKHEFHFAVSKDYFDPDVKFTYGDLTLVTGVDTDKTKKASSAVTTVSNIINLFADESDYNKLCGYRNCICALVNYDDDAADTANVHALQEIGEPFYGDPWQLISVFDYSAEDGTFDHTDNVVCEGYSKAFQYLCDRSSFNKDIECYTVQGNLFNERIPAGSGHMWNIVRIEDCNYIADITNSDCWNYKVSNWDELILAVTDYKNYMSRSDVFLSGWRGNNSTIATGYTYNYEYSWIKYVYDEFTMGGNRVKGMFGESELTLSNTAYDPNASDPQPVRCSAKAPGCTEPGNVERWLKQGYYYKIEDENCSNKLSYTETEISPLGHDWDAGAVAIAATEDTAGTKVYTCKRCGITTDEWIPMLPHTHRYSKTESLDYTTYTCTGCGDSYTKSKVVVDLPKVSIKKPAGSKAGFTVKWKKLSTKKRKKIKGYEIQYSTRKDFAYANSVLRTAAKSKASKKIKKLARKKKYYVRVRSYKWIGGVKHVSKWSSKKSVKTK